MKGSQQDFVVEKTHGLDNTNFYVQVRSSPFLLAFLHPL
jgi:hypothetical protein